MLNDEYEWTFNFKIKFENRLSFENKLKYAQIWLSGLTCPVHVGVQIFGQNFVRFVAKRSDWAKNRDSDSDCFGGRVLGCQKNWKMNFCQFDCGNSVIFNQDRIRYAWFKRKFLTILNMKMLNLTQKWRGFPFLQIWHVYQTLFHPQFYENQRNPKPLSDIVSGFFQDNFYKHCEK